MISMDGRRIRRKDGGNEGRRISGHYFFLLFFYSFTFITTQRYSPLFFLLTSHSLLFQYNIFAHTLHTTHYLLTHTLHSLYAHIPSHTPSLLAQLISLKVQPFFKTSQTASGILPFLRVEKQSSLSSLVHQDPLLSLLSSSLHSTTSHFRISSFTHNTTHKAILVSFLPPSKKIIFITIKK